MSKMIWTDRARMSTFSARHVNNAGLAMSTRHYAVTLERPRERRQASNFFHGQEFTHC